MHMCENVNLYGYTVKDSGNWANAICDSTNISMKNVTVIAGHDGIHITKCNNVTVSNCNFYTGDDCVAGLGNINVVVKASSPDIKGSPQARVWLSHKELLGTWEENAAMFHIGETVAGVVRSVEDYGIFIELAPNLAGLAEPKENVQIGQSASVYIKALIPEKMKVKLIIVDVFNSDYSAKNFKYFIKSGHIDYWKYTTADSDKVIETVFTP